MSKMLGNAVRKLRPSRRGVTTTATVAFSSHHHNLPFLISRRVTSSFWTSSLRPERFALSRYSGNQVRHSSSSSVPDANAAPSAEDEPSEQTKDEEGQGEQEYTLQLSQEEMQELSKGDPDLIKRIKYIQLEHEVYRQEGLDVPSRVTMRHWQELLLLPSPPRRKKYYHFLFLNEMKASSFKVKKQLKREARLKELEGSLWPTREEDVYGMAYGLGRNTIFLRLYETTINRFYNGKVAQAMMFSRPMVVDCGYEEFMTNRESKNCAKQLEIMITENRCHSQPFDLTLCNLKEGSNMMRHLLAFNPALTADTHPISITEKSYLDLYPKKNLVYLTPQAKDELDEYDEDDVYIIGAMVDKSDPRPVSFAKAKREKLRMRKLPLDRHLVWGCGGKALTLNQMILIMLDLRLTQDWKVALDHVPKRKLNRDFHPYPDQIQNYEEGESQPDDDEQGQRRFMPPPLSPTFSRRRERPSQVLEDFELLNRRKGFRKFDQSASPNFMPLGRGGSDSDSSRGKINARKLFED